MSPLSVSVAVRAAPTFVPAALFSATLREAVGDENVGAVLPAVLVCPDPGGDQGCRRRRWPCQVFFDKTPQVQQSAVVANKRLGAVLGKIRSDQQERDRQRLANRNVTLRQKDRIRVAIARAAASDPRPDL